MADTAITIEVDGSFADLLDAKRKVMAKAATESARQVASLVKQRAASEIASAGFSARWQESIQAKVFPEGKDAIDPTVYVYDRIPYSGVFETGAIIEGKPLLWLPLPSAKDFLAGDQRVKPRDFASLGLTLVSIAGAKSPLLGVREAQGEKVHVTPVFIGVSAVAIQKKFNLQRALQQAADRWPSLYASAFRDA